MIETSDIFMLQLIGTAKLRQTLNAFVAFSTASNRSYSFALKIKTSTLTSNGRQQPSTGIEESQSP